MVLKGSTWDAETRKAKSAKQDLEMETGRSTFQILMMDVSDVHSVRSAIRLLPEPVDALVMNAGGMAAIFQWL